MEIPSSPKSHRLPILFLIIGLLIGAGVTWGVVALVGQSRSELYNDISFQIRAQIEEEAKMQESSVYGLVSEINENSLVIEAYTSAPDVTRRYTFTLSDTTSFVAFESATSTAEEPVHVSISRDDIVSGDTVIVIADAPVGDGVQVLHALEVKRF